MRFDLIYPAGESDLSRALFPRMIHSWRYAPEPCMVCKSETQWYEVSFEAPFCSQECLAKMDADFEAALAAPIPHER